MTNPKPRPTRSQRSRLLSLTILWSLLLTASPLRIYAQGPRPLVAPQQPSQPCADSDRSERCQLKRAVSAALDEIESLRKQLKAASEAIAAQEQAIKAANEAIAAGAKERDSYEQTIKIADKAIAQQQSIIASYERAIATLQTMVDMALKRIDALETKVDRANARTAKMALLTTLLGIGAAILIRR